MTGGGPGGIVVNGGVTTTGLSGITSAGPNNAAGVWNRRNLFTYTDDLQISKGIHQISAGVWFQRVQDNEDSASRQLGQATFTSLTTFLQGTVSSFQVVPNANELGWRSLFGAWYVEGHHQAAPQSHASRGHPARVHHRLERSLRARRQLHHRRERRAGDRAARRRFRLHGE